MGKTTLSAAFALSCARRGHRTLLIQLNVQDRVSAMFGSQKIGTEIVEIEENLYGVNVTPQAAMEEYALMVLRMRLVYRAVFENRIVSSFLRVIPGLNELVMLGKAYFHAVERDEATGRFAWDRVVVDAPATGHGIFLLRIPTVVTSLISSGPMYEDAQRIQELLRDPQTTAINLVTLPEEMPVNETLMLRDVVHQDLGVPPGFVAVNQVVEPLFEPQEVEAVEEAEAALRRGAGGGDGERLGGFLDAALFRAQRVAMQQPHLERLREMLGQERLLEIPFYFSEYIDFQTLSEIADRLDAALGAGSGGSEEAGQTGSGGDGDDDGQAQVAS